jgi:hypothetical protein
MARGMTEVLRVERVIPRQSNEMSTTGSAGNQIMENLMTYTPFVTSTQWLLPLHWAIRVDTRHGKRLWYC